MFDEDNNGGIIFKGLKKVARDLGEHMTDEELQDMITEGAMEGNVHITTNARGVDKKEPKVTLNEFMQIMEKDF
jgi:Ca2+-binding EF-hand superfamily protein